MENTEKEYNVFVFISLFVAINWAVLYLIGHLSAKLALILVPMGNCTYFILRRQKKILKNWEKSKKNWKISKNNA